MKESSQKFDNHREPGVGTEETELYLIEYQDSVISAYPLIPLWLN